MRIFSGKSVFLKFWKYDKANSIYEQTNLLGGKEGISGTTIGGSSVGVNKYISDENKKYALEVIKFMLSKEVQKQMILDYKVFSAMRDLYDDEEVCKAVNCDLINNVQMIQDPKILYNYDYYIQFKTFLTNYLKKNESEAESVEETSGKLDDITKIYHVSIGTEDSILGLVVFIIIMVLIVLMVFSIIFLFIPKYESYFEFLSKDFWILIVIGSISGLGTILTLYGEMVPYKCFLNSLFVCFSSTFRIIPILQKLISNFPGENKILQWIKNNERLFVWTCIINDAFINFLLYIMWFDVMNVYIPYNKNYTICVMFNPFAAFITFISSLEKIAVLFLVILFLFMEWNIKSTKKDIKTVSYAFMLNSSVFFLILTFNFVNFTDYFGFFFIISSLNILFSVSNFFFIYGARIVWIFKKNDLDVEKKNKVKERKLESVLMKFKLSTYDEDKNGNNADENAAIDYKTSTTYSNSKSIISKVINYHYYTGEQKSDNFNIELSSKFLSNQNYAETINIYNTSTFRKKNNANKPTVNNLFNNCNGNNNITDTTNNSTTTTTTNNTNTNNTNTNNNNTNNTNTNNNNTNNTNTNNNNTNMNTNTNTNTNNTNTSNTNTNMNTNINTNTNTNTNTNDIII